MPKTYPSIGVQIPRLLLPRPEIDLTKWAVVACDQFTSQPEYWRQVEALVGGAPSTFHLILPEVYLGKPEENARLTSIQAAMRSYLDQDLLQPLESLVLVERSVAGRTRHGLMLALDLEKYDYTPRSQTLIRATEGTILDRLPPRIKIRQGAPLELPHILVLIDDPDRTVIEPLVRQKGRLSRAYDTDLMLGSGHLTGYRVDRPDLEQNVVSALENLAQPETFSFRHKVDPEKKPLLFAMGDGNHSFATARAIWESLRASARPDHPARFALVEIENVHDEGLVFEPIHRVAFEVREDLAVALKRAFGDSWKSIPCVASGEMVQVVDQQSAPGHSFGVISPSGCSVVSIDRPSFTLPVGTLQAFLDNWEHASGYAKIDYVHGLDVVASLGAQPGNLGFYLPAMPKSDLFRTVIQDGALPRKTFSMGEAIEKRFYMECRSIVP